MSAKTEKAAPGVVGRLDELHDRLEAICDDLAVLTTEIEGADE